jgi:hypothetical protein
MAGALREAEAPVISKRGCFWFRGFRSAERPGHPTREDYNAPDKPRRPKNAGAGPAE